MSEQEKMDQERAAFEAWVIREWPNAPLHYVRDALPKDDPRYGEYCDEHLQRAWVGWQARASLPVGVPDGWRDALQKIAKYAPPVNCAAKTEVEKLALIAVHALIAFSAPQFSKPTDHQSAKVGTAAPTVKAEQVQCEFCDDTGQIQGTDCGRCAPSLPAAGSAAAVLLPALRQYRHNCGGDELIPGYDYEEANRIVAALSAQQSAPERVNVPVELLTILASEGLSETESDRYVDAVMDARALLAQREWGGE